MHDFRVQTVLLAASLLLLTGCASDADPRPDITHSERMSLQNECTKIADRSERERCIERASFDRGH